MKIFAHRGSSLLWPENTLLAFDNAHQAGAAGFETDLRLSGDNVIILSHDDNLARFGRTDITVSALSAEEVCQIEIPSIDKKYADRLIRLETLLEKYPGKDYIFDLKISDELLVEKLKQLLEKMDLHDRVWFLTWSQKADDLLEKYFPGYKYFPRWRRTTVWGWGSIIRLGRLFEPQHEILSLPAFHRGLSLFTKGQIASLKKRGKTFLGYLVNTRKEYQRCKACGVDMVLTDRPDLIALWESSELQ